MPRQSVRTLFHGDPRYKTYLDILEKEELIKVDHRYVPSAIAAQTGGKPLCKRYRITKKGESLLNDANEARIKFNLTSEGKKIIRDSSSCRRKTKQVITDVTAARILRYLKEIINIDELYELNKVQPWEERKHNNSILASLTEHMYEVSLNDKTGRFYTPYTNMTRSLKEKIKLKDGQILRCKIDARSCHPSFFGLYCQSLTDEDITGELLIWNHIFFVQKEHPMRAIYKECGMEYNDATKKYFLSYLNGSQSERYCPQFTKWLSTNFPKMFIIWSNSDKSKTGSTISKVYESAVFRHPKVTELGEQLGVTVCDNHDELMLYANNERAVRAFVDIFKSFSYQIFNLKIVLKEEWFDENGKKIEADSIIPEDSAGEDNKSKHLK